MNPLCIHASRWGGAWVVALLMQPATALTLDEALHLAGQEAPALQALRAQQQAARSAAIPAAELPDPQLTLGLQNLPFEEDDRWSPDRERMTQQVVGIRQQVPNSDKRAAWQAVANAEVALTEAQYQLTRLQVRQRTALAWISALAVHQKLALFQDFYRENRLFERAIQALIAGGQGLTADSVLPHQERAHLEEQEDDLRRQQRSAQAALERWIGPHRDLEPQGPWPYWPGTEAMYRQNLRQHPGLQTYNPRRRRAQAQVEEAIADKTPDWGWALDYQRRGKAYSDMVSLRVSFDLPLFTRTRQDPRIAARQAEAVAVDAEQEDAVRRYAQQLEDLLAERHSLQRAVTRLDKTLLPLAEQHIKLAMADYRGGRGSLLAVVAARREAVQTRLRRIDLQEQLSQTHARLHFAYGEVQ